MIKFLLERTLLMSALSCLILALFWTHVRPLFFKLINNIYIIFFNQSYWISTHEVNRIKRSHGEHPKFSGANLRKRSSSDREPYRSSFNPFTQDIGQSLVDSNPSFLNSPSHLQLSAPSRGGFVGANGPASNGPPASLFTLFTGCVIGLIIYTMMKMFGAKLSPEINDFQRISDGRSNNCESITKDMLTNRKSLLRMNRDDRVKHLIRHHGGKNVSLAIKFLAIELEKQRKILCENLQQQIQTTSNNNCSLSSSSSPTTPGICSHCGRERMQQMRLNSTGSDLEYHSASED